MTQYMSMDFIHFLLMDVLNIENLLQEEKYQDYDKESVFMLLDSMKTYSDKELYPYFREMDEHPVVYKDGKIIVHPQIGKLMKDSAEQGWLGIHFPYEDGGMQVPHVVSNAIFHIMEAANNNVTGYVGLTTGAADLIRTFGDRSLFDAYVPKMLSGEWGGTMCLTEPQAGSSLSDIKTTAYPQADGSYKIKGQKIFISGGDHEYCENFVHLTLVRIEGAPKGTKGISLMVVPKKRILEDGRLQSNDVVTAGDFQKLGQKGYATTHLVFGENDDCYGYLVGEANLGLKYMFLMMNGARIDVGLTAASTMMAAYYASLQYARERPQGRKLQSTGKKDPTAEQTLIINHPDVRRMLLLQKAYSEGSVALLLECSMLTDLVHVKEGEEKKAAADMLDLLTPIAKTFPSEKGITSISNGLQVLGGYGFCSDFILQQYYRDIRIMSLYEGTTGIQSIDLLGRKVLMNNGETLKALAQDIMEAIQNASTFDDLKAYGAQLGEALNDVQKALAHLMPYAQQGNFQAYLADATIFMDLMGTVVIAYQWLKMATKAKEKLVKGDLQASEDFYESKIHTMKFFFKYDLTHVKAHLETILSKDQLTLRELEEEKIFA